MIRGKGGLYILDNNSGYGEHIFLAIDNRSRQPNALIDRFHCLTLNSYILPFCTSAPFRVHPVGAVRVHIGDPQHNSSKKQNSSMHVDGELPKPALRPAALVPKALYLGAAIFFVMWLV